MMKKHVCFEYDLMDEQNTVASATECTGLVRIPPRNSYESEAYGQIYVIPKQVNDFEKVKKAKGRHIKSAPDLGQN